MAMPFDAPYKVAQRRARRESGWKPMMEYQGRFLGCRGRVYYTQGTTLRRDHDWSWRYLEDGRVEIQRVKA